MWIDRQIDIYVYICTIYIYTYYVRIQPGTGSKSMATAPEASRQQLSLPEKGGTEGH